MYRQLWLAIILSTVLAVMGSLFSSTFSTRDYLSEQLRMKNEDNATVLALSLSQKEMDAVELDLFAASLFNSGHYASIRISDANGKTIVEKSAQEEKNSVPAWFKRILPMRSTPGFAQINNGWKAMGGITVISQSTTAYQTLWQSTLDLLLALSIAGFIGGYLATLILRRLKQPLQAVVQQAVAMRERRFIITPESKVPELKQLTSAMNSTVNLIKSMFSEEAMRLEQLRKQANTDPVTQLSNRPHFTAQLQVKLEDEDMPSGSLIMLRLGKLMEINQRLGHQKTDALLRQIGQTLHQVELQHDHSLAARLNGSDFALLIPENDAEICARTILNEIIAITTEVQDISAIFIGYGQYEAGMVAGALLAQVDSALASAENRGINNVQKAAPLNIEHAPRSAEEWSKLILRSLEQNWVKLAYFPVTDVKGDLIHYESALRLMFGGEWFSAGRFLPIAERLNLSPRLDLVAVKLALDHLSRLSKPYKIALNLSAKSLFNEEFRQQLKQLLRANPAVASQLCFEIPENGALMNIDALRSFVVEIKAYGCEFGLEHFGLQLEKFNQIQDLRIDYLKLDGSFIKNIDYNQAHQTIVQGIINIAQRLSMKTIALGTMNISEFDTLKQLNVDGVTGPAISKLFPHEIA
jgi:diguanylate cyclase (GGDEF)-like protein